MIYNRFTVIDFETANNDRKSACAIGIVVVENMLITEAHEYLIKPLDNYFIYTDVHGITWNDVKNAKDFKELWPTINKYFQNIDFIAAHNAAFDMGVLKACCNYYGIPVQNFKSRCTCKLAKKKLSLPKNSLDEVCRYYNIELNHHNALSDCLGCAKILINLLK